MNENKFVTTFEIVLNGTTNKIQNQNALKALNKFYLDDEDCNKFNNKTKRYEDKYKNHPNKEPLLQSHINLARANLHLKVKVGLDLEGRLHLIEVIDYDYYRNY